MKKGPDDIDMMTIDVSSDSENDFTPEHNDENLLRKLQSFCDENGIFRGFKNGSGAKKIKCCGSVSDVDVPADPECKLHTAVLENDVEAVRTLLEKDTTIEVDDKLLVRPTKTAKKQKQPNVALNVALVDTVDSRGNTALHIAAVHADLEINKLLIDAGMNTEIYNAAGRTALFLAVFKQREEIVEYLLQQGANADAMQCKYSRSGTRDNCMLSECCAYHESDRIAELLMEYGAAVNNEDKSTAIYECIERDNYNLVRKITENGFDVNGNHTESDDTMIQCTAAFGKPNLLKAFVDGGANLDYKDNCLEGDGPLMMVTEECVTVLCEGGARVNCRNLNHETPLHKAACRDDLESVKTLIAHGACVNARQIEGLTPLCLAMLYRADDTANYLLSVNTNVNARDDMGYGALFFTPDFWEACAAAGGNLNAVAPEVGGMLHMAAEKSDAGVARLAIKLGANVNLTNHERSETALHIAAKYGAHHVSNVLITAGANLELQDKNGRAPLNVAFDNKNPEVMTSLLVGGANAHCLFQELRFWLKHPVLRMIEFRSDATLIRSFVEAGLRIDPIVAGFCAKGNRNTFHYNHAIRTLLLNNQNVF